MFVPASDNCNRIHINIDTGSTTTTRWYLILILILILIIIRHHTIINIDNGSYARKWQIKTTQYTFTFSLPHFHFYIYVRKWQIKTTQYTCTLSHFHYQLSHFLVHIRQEVADKDNPVHLREREGSETGLSSVPHSANRFPLHLHSWMGNTEKWPPGTFASFGWDTSSSAVASSQTHLVNQQYDVCIRSSSSSFFVDWDIIVIIIPILYLSHLIWDHTSPKAGCSRYWNTAISPPTKF